MVMLFTGAAILGGYWLTIMGACKLAHRYDPEGGDGAWIVGVAWFGYPAVLGSIFGAF